MTSSEKMLLRLEEALIELKNHGVNPRFLTAHPDTLNLLSEAAMNRWLSTEIEINIVNDYDARISKYNEIEVIEDGTAPLGQFYLTEERIARHE